jgi:phage regulator Rha-like protein
MFTKDEKKVLSQLVKERIESLEKQEQLPTDLVANLAMDVKYEDFLKNILKKLKE